MFGKRQGGLWAALVSHFYLFSPKIALLQFSLRRSQDLTFAADSAILLDETNIPLNRKDTSR